MRTRYRSQARPRSFLPNVHAHLSVVPLPAQDRAFASLAREDAHAQQVVSAGSFFFSCACVPPRRGTAAPSLAILAIPLASRHCRARAPTQPAVPYLNAQAQQPQARMRRGPRRRETRRDAPAPSPPTHSRRLCRGVGAHPSRAGRACAVTRCASGEAGAVPSQAAPFCGKSAEIQKHNNNNSKKHTHASPPTRFCVKWATEPGSLEWRRLCRV